MRKIVSIVFFLSILVLMIPYSYAISKDDVQPYLGIWRTSDGMILAIGYDNSIDNWSVIETQIAYPSCTVYSSRSYLTYDKYDDAIYVADMIRVGSSSAELQAIVDYKLKFENGQLMMYKMNNLRVEPPVTLENISAPPKDEE